MITSAAKIYHLLLLKELHELGDINDEEYTDLIRTLFSMATDEMPTLRSKDAWEI